PRPPKAHQGSSEPSRRRNLPVSSIVSRSISARIDETLSSGVISAPAPPMSVFTQPGLSKTHATPRDFASSARLLHAMLSAAFEVRYGTQPPPLSPMLPMPLEMAIILPPSAMRGRSE